MNPAWIGVIGTALGTLVGAGLSLLVNLRQQQQAPRLAVLEKRIEAHQELYARLYALAEVVHRVVRGTRQDFIVPYGEFKQAFLQRRFYLDQKSIVAVTAMYNFIQPVLDGGELRVEQFQELLNNATSALVQGIGLRYE